MRWLTVLTLPDGSWIECNLMGVQSGDTHFAANPYRYVSRDGSVNEFSTLASIVRHLDDLYQSDDFNFAIISYETPVSNRAAESSGPTVTCTSSGMASGPGPVAAIVMSGQLEDLDHGPRLPGSPGRRGWRR